MKRSAPQALTVSIYGALQQPIPFLSLSFFNPKILLAKDANGDAGSLRKNRLRRILLVDDELDLTTIFRSALRHVGYEVVAYNDPDEALVAFRSDQYDLMIFDVRMPGMSGFELFSRIRKIDSNVKALFVTAYADYEHEFLVTLPDLDIKCVLQKPLHLRQLQDAVKEALGDKE